MPFFASILSVLSIVFHSAGFLRVELELNEQKKRINALESVGEAKSNFNILDLVTRSKEITPGKFLKENTESYNFPLRSFEALMIKNLWATFNHLANEPN